MTARAPFLRSTISLAVGAGRPPEAEHWDASNTKSGAGTCRAACGASVSIRTQARARWAQDVGGHGDPQPSSQQSVILTSRGVCHRGNWIGTNVTVHLI